MTLLEFNKFISDGSFFLENLIQELAAKGLSVEGLQCDHLCFRVDSMEKYKEFFHDLSGYGDLLTESMVNGRPISTFRLSNHFKFRDHSTSVIELPAPKPGTTYTTGFEHAEFVISEDIVSFANKYPHLNFSTTKKKINTELQLPLECGQVKFHRLSLERVIEIEKSKITDVVLDFDGTIIDSRNAIYEINRLVFSKVLNRTVSMEESVKNFHPEFHKLFEAYGVVQSSQKSLAIDLWGAVSGEFEFHLFDGIIEMLKNLREGSLRLHLWTARDKISAMKILSSHGLLDFFETMSFSSNVKSKPHQDSLLFNWNAASKNTVLVIGDSVTDIQGARNIQAIPGAALWCTHSVYELLEKNGAEIFFSNPGDVTKWILELKH